MGLTDKPIESLSTLARSWLQPPELKTVTDGFGSEEYSRDQRAYVLKRQSNNESGLVFELAGSESSPVSNLAFVIRNWGRAPPKLTLTGKSVKTPCRFRYAHRHTLDGTDLIVWVECESEEPIRIALSRTGN